MKTENTDWNVETIRTKDFFGELYSPCKKNTGTGVVLVPSSAGVTDSRERAYAAAFAARGCTALIADAFARRGVKECLTDQGRISAETLLESAFTAHEILKKEHGIERIGIHGVSKGGGVALSAALHHPMYPHAPRFAFHICSAPSVFVQMRHPRTIGGPILFLLAEKDDFTLAAPVYAYAARILKDNPEAEVKCFMAEGAHHAWESRGEVKFLANAERYAHCSFYIEDNGMYSEGNDEKHLFSRDEFLRTFRTRAALGAHYGGGTDTLFQKTVNTIFAFIEGTACGHSAAACGELLTPLPL